MACLKIDKVANSDKGEYRAVARNQHGEGVATINLNFQGTGKPKYERFSIFSLFLFLFPSLIFTHCSSQLHFIQSLSIEKEKEKYTFEKSKEKY